ncbi:hypothetical protein D3C76_1257210 [compost metagenome]
MSGIETAPVLLARIAIHGGIKRQLRFRRIQRGDAVQHPGHVHVHRRELHREAGRTLPFHIVNGIGHPVVRLQVDAVPAVGELDPDIKLHGIIGFSQPTDFTHCICVTFTVGA